jgi:hypothetical protein
LALANAFNEESITTQQQCPQRWKGERRMVSPNRLTAFMLLRLRLTEQASLFAHLRPKNAFGHAFCFLLNCSGRKTNFLLRLRRSILGSENLSHRMNDARVKSCLNPGRACRLIPQPAHTPSVSAQDRICNALYCI